MFSNISSIRYVDLHEFKKYAATENVSSHTKQYTCSSVLHVFSTFVLYTQLISVGVFVCLANHTAASNTPTNLTFHGLSFVICHSILFTFIVIQQVFLENRLVKAMTINPYLGYKVHVNMRTSLVQLITCNCMMKSYKYIA